MSENANETVFLTSEVEAKAGVVNCCDIGVACCRTGRRYIGIENEKQYYDVMRTRLRECCRSHSKEAG